MSPSFVTIDPSPDIDIDIDFDSAAPASTAGKFATTTPSQNGGHDNSSSSSSRTLLLAPPSVASHEGKLRTLFTSFDRATTDLQMLDRLSAGLVQLPPTTYDLVLLLADAGGPSRQAPEASQLLSRDVFARLVPSMRPGARLQAQDGAGAGDGGGLLLGSPTVRREAVLAGLLERGASFQKSALDDEAAVPLRFGAKKKKPDGVANGGANGSSGSSSSPGGWGAAAHGSAGPAVGTVTVDVGGRPTKLDMVPPAARAPAGVGFVDFSDDLDDVLDDLDDDDELIDEDELMTEEDLKRPIVQPPECQPKPGQRRRACKDCTCGMAERLEAEDRARRARADRGLATLKLKSEDLNELDFTVKGKTGSCGNCALGDAFRCAGCPYIGLPAFKPGEEVTILNNIAQL